jgi:hypothetical protein
MFDALAHSGTLTPMATGPDIDLVHGMPVVAPSQRQRMGFLRAD